MTDLAPLALFLLALGLTVALGTRSRVCGVCRGDGIQYSGCGRERPCPMCDGEGVRRR